MNRAPGRRGPVAVAILAAGSSKRMGASKQLLRWEGQSLLRRTYEVAHSARAEHLVVTLDPAATAVVAEIRGATAMRAFVGQPELGQSESVRVALSAVQTTDSVAILFVPCDLPLLSTEHLNALIARYHESAAAMVASAYDGKLGSPMLLDRSLWPELKALRGDTGARSLLKLHPELCTSIHWPEGEFDVDTPEDWTRLLELGSQGPLISTSQSQVATFPVPTRDGEC